MGVYKNIFVSDEFEGLEAGTQVQGIDGSVRVFGESAFSSLEQAVSSVAGKAVIARVASGKYDYFVADGNGSVSPASQVVFVDFNGGSGLSYDNGEYSRSVEMAPAAYSEAQQADVVAALNDLNAESGVVFTASAPQGTEFSTIYVGATSSFDDLGTFKGLSETVDTGNAVKNDEAFVNTNNISSVEELVEVIDHEAGHLVGEEHEVTSGDIDDFAATRTIHSGESFYVDSANDNNTYIVEDGGTLYIQRRQWMAQAPVTVAAGGKVIKNGSMETYTHIKSRFTLGEAGEGKTVTPMKMSSDSYPWSVSVLYNGTFTANNADIWVGDFGAIGNTTINDSTFKASGIFAVGKPSPGTTSSTYNINLARTTVTVDGKNIRDDAGFFSKTGNQLNKLTMDASSITFRYIEGTTTAEKTTMRQVTMTNGSIITVEAGLDAIIGRTAASDRSYNVIDYAAGNYTFSIDATSSLTAGNLRIDESYATLALVADDTVSVSFSGTFSNAGTISVNMADAEAGTLYKIMDFTGEGDAPTLADYGTISYTNLAEGYIGAATVVDGDLYVQTAQAIAEVNGVKFTDLPSAYAAAAAGTTAEEKTVKLLVDEIADINGIPAGVTLEGVEGRTAVTVTLGQNLNDVTIRNIKFAGTGNALRWCYVDAGHTTTIENCEFANSGSYGIHFDGTNNGIVIVRDSYLKNWNSSNPGFFFDNCVIDAGAVYSEVRPYEFSSFTNCRFTEAFVEACKADGDMGVEQAGNFALEMINCSVVKSQDDQSESTKYAVSDVLNPRDNGALGEDSMIVIDPVKDGEGKYTNGMFFANKASAVDSYLAEASLGAIVGNSRGLIYELPEEGSAAIEICDSIAGTVDVPDDVTLTVADGISYGADAKLTGNVTFDIKNAAGSVTFDDSTVTSKISNITEAATTAFVSENTLSGASIMVAGTMTNSGTLNIDLNSSVSAASFSGAEGSINVNAEGFSGSLLKLIDTNDNGSFGTVNVIGTDSFESQVIEGDLFLTKSGASTDTAVEQHTGLGGDDVYVASKENTDVSVAGDVESTTGSVSIDNSGEGSLSVGDVTAANNVEITTGGNAQDTLIGNVVAQENVSVTNNGTGTMEIGAITSFATGEDQGVTISNTGSGNMVVVGDTVVAEKLEIRNETDNDLSHSGKLAAKDIKIYNNDQTKDTTVGEINITQQIEALGDITITNSSEISDETTKGVVNLGTQEHTAQGGLEIVNTTNNVINGGGSAATEDEQAANITVKEEVVITNDGHMNANIKTDKAIEITNTSVNTLIGSYEGAELNLDNTGGAAHDVTLTATSGDISVVNAKAAGVGGTIDNVTMTAAGIISISGDGATTNAVINTDTLYMGGTSVAITDGTILAEGSTIFLGKDENDDPVPGAELTITGDHTVGTRIEGRAWDPVSGDDAVYGTVTMNGTQTYTGDIAADAIVVAANADVTIDNVTEGSTQFDFNTLEINGTLTTDFDAQDSFTGAGAVTGAGNLQISTDGEWIINDSVYRDFSGFTGKVSMTENNAEITMGLGDALALDATDSYFADGVEMTAAATQAINLKGEDVTTGIVFKGAGTLNVFENQTLSADNEIVLTQVSEGKTLTLTGSTFTGDITLDKDADTAATTLKLNNAGLTVTGAITGDTDDIIDVAAAAELDEDAALDAFTGTVALGANALTLSGANDTAATFTGTTGTITAGDDQTFSADGALDGFAGTVAVGDNTHNSVLTLSGVNETAAVFTGTGTGSISLAADQEFTADGALDGFTGTVAVGANELELEGANTTAATFTGTGTITAEADQTLSGDISGFSGTIVAEDSEVTISGTVADALNVAGDTITLDDAVAHATPIAVNAVSALDVLNANDNNIVAASGTITGITADEGNVTLTGATVDNVLTDEGNIDLTGYTAGALKTVISTAGAVLITSAQNITVDTALAADLAYTVTAAQTDATADLTFTNGTLSYTNDITVTAAVSSYFESPYKLLGAQTLNLANTFSVNLTVGSDSGDIVIGNAAKIGDKFYQLSLTGDAGTMQYLELTVFSGTSNIAYVNNTDPVWTAAVPYAEVFDTFYADPTISVKRNIGYDAAASIDNAIGYIVADETGANAGKGWIELTENVTYSISTALGTAANKVTEMTLRSRADWGNAKVTGDINAGAATTLNLENLTATGSVYGAGTVNITGAKANRFSGTNIAAGGELNITGGTYTTRYIAGGAYNTDSTAPGSVTINGAADRTSINGSIYGGSIASGSGIAVTQTGKASVTIDSTDLVAIASGIYAAGLARAGATLNVTGDREVTFTGSGANLNFAGRVSGAAQVTGTGSAANITGGSANLNFADFTGKFNGSISDFNTITISGGSAVEFGRRQTLTGNTALSFALNSDSDSTTGTAMYSVRDKNAWEFAKSITITADSSTKSGSYVLADNYAAGFDGFTFTVAGQNYTLGNTTTDNYGNTYSVGYAGEKLSLTFGNAADTQVIDNVASQDANDKEFIIYNTDVNNASLENADNVEKISATAGTTVVFNDSTYADANQLDQNAAGALLYKATDTSTPTPTTSIEWVGNSDTANVTGGLSADSMDISGKTLTVDTANITDLNVNEDANLNLTSGNSSIDTITMAADTNLTLDVGSGATVSGTGTGALEISGSNGTVTINNEGTLTAQVTSAGTVIITNTSTNSLYGEFGGEGTELIALDNTGKVANASFTADTVVLNDAVNAATGRLGFYQNITVDAEELILNADLSGWNLAVDVEFPGAIYNFANAAEVSALNFTIDSATSFGDAELVAAVTGADLSETVFTVNGADLALGETVSVGGDAYEFNLYNGNAYFFKGAMPVADMSTLVIDSALADIPAFTVVTYEGKDYIVGLNAFSTTAQMRAAMTEDTENLLFKAGNAESYGDLDVDQDVTILTTGEGEALLSRYQTDSKTTPANTVTVAEGSTFRFTVAGALNAQDTIILNGTLIFNTSSSAGDMNMYTKSAITVNETGSLVYETYAMQNTREPLTVYGTMVIGDPNEDTSTWSGYAIGSYPKIAGNEGGTDGTLIVDGSEGAGTVEIYAPAFSVAAGYAATWRDSGANGLVTVQNGGSITSNAYMFRNGTNGVITVTDGSSFTINPDDKYAGIHKLSGYATGNDGAINVLNGSTVDFGTLADFVNFETGAITIDTESLLTATSLTNSGTITIDAADFAGGYKKVIDLDQETALSGIELINAAEGVSLSYAEDGDVYVVDSSSLIGTFYVSADWSGLEPGAEVTVIPGVTAIYGTDAFSSVKAAMGSRTATAGAEVIICSDIDADMSATNEYLQGWGAYVSPADSVVTVEAGKNLTGKNYYIGNDTEDRWDGDTFTPTDKLVLEAGATLGTPAVQDNTAIYVRGTGEIDAKSGVTIGQQPGNIVNLMDYGKVSLTGTTAYLDGFVVYGVDLNDDPETLTKAEFNAVNSTIDVTGSLNGSRCNQYTVGGIQTAALIGGKSGKGDGTANLTDTTMTVGTNLVIGFDKNGTLNVDGGSVTVGGTVGVGLDAGSGVVNLTDAEFTADEVVIGENGAINIADGVFTAETLANNGTVTATSGNVTLNISDSATGNMINVLDGVTLSGSMGMLNVTGGVTLDGVTVAATKSGGETSNFDSDSTGTRDTIVVNDFTFNNTSGSESGIWVGYPSGVDVEVTGAMNLTGSSSVFFNSYNASNVTVTETGSIVTNGQMRISGGSTMTVTGTGVENMDDAQLSGTGYICVDGGSLSLTDTVVSLSNYIVIRNYGANNVSITNSDVTLTQIYTNNKSTSTAGGTITVDNSTITLTGSNGNPQNLSGYTFNLINGSTMTAASGRFDEQKGTFNIVNSSLYLGGAAGGQNYSLVNSGTISVGDHGDLTTREGINNKAGSTITLESTANLSISGNDQWAKLDNAGTLSLDVDSVLNGVVKTNGIVQVNGILDLATDVAGSKILTGNLTDNGSAFKIEGEDGYVDAELNGDAVQIAGAGTETTDDDVWAQLSNSNSAGDLTVSWGRSVNEVTAAADALNAQKNDMTIGQAVVADAASLSDGIDASDYQKKNNGTLA